MFILCVYKVLLIWLVYQVQCCVNCQLSAVEDMLKLACANEHFDDNICLSHIYQQLLKQITFVCIAQWQTASHGTNLCSNTVLHDRIIKHYVIICLWTIKEQLAEFLFVTYCMQVDTIDPVAGVTVLEGGRTRQGPKVIEVSTYPVS